MYEYEGVLQWFAQSRDSLKTTPEVICVGNEGEG